MLFRLVSCAAAVHNESVADAFLRERCRALVQVRKNRVGLLTRRLMRPSALPLVFSLLDGGFAQRVNVDCALLSAFIGVDLMVSVLPFDHAVVTAIIFRIEVAVGSMLHSMLHSDMNVRSQEDDSKFAVGGRVGAQSKDFFSTVLGGTTQGEPLSTFLFDSLLQYIMKPLTGMWKREHRGVKLAEHEAAQ